VEGLKGKIVFEPEYRVAEAVKGLEKYSHIWLLWEFSEAKREKWSPTVRPPRLGGKKRVGVFATRSPFRPNPLGLSSVKLLGVDNCADGLVLHVAGADLADGTPIFDIKPYVEYADAHTAVRSGFVDSNSWQMLEVVFPDELRAMFNDDDLRALIKILELDPRPQYHNDPERLYGMPYGDYDVRFTVSGNVLTVVEIGNISVE
jgi:tRNA-Thr(GGU) m(6)t(6)A37 methyltransferase TsaA